MCKRSLVIMHYKGNETANNTRGGTAMFWNCEGLFACMLLVPVVLNILVPLAMLPVWLVKYMVTGKSWPDTGDEYRREGPMPIPA